MPESICFVNDAFLYDDGVVITGPMVQMYNLGVEFKRRGWDVSYVSASANTKKVKYIHLNGHNIFYYKRQKYSELFSVHKLWRLLDAANADYYYQRGRSPLTGLVAFYVRVRKKKFIWASAGEDGIELNKYTREQLPRKKIFKRIVLYPLFWVQDKLYHYGIKVADFRFVQTEYQRSRLSRNFSLDSTVLKSGHIVPDITEYVKPTPPIVLWVSSIKKVKQPEIFLQLVQELQNENAEFYMVGDLTDTDYCQKIKNCVRKIKKFKYLGQIPYSEINQLYARCSILVNTTLDGYEGLPNAFIQAWLNCVPVVSLSSNPDNVISEYEIGCQEASTQLLFETVRNLIRDNSLRVRLGNNARAFAISQYGISYIVDRFLNTISCPLNA